MPLSADASQVNRILAENRKARYDYFIEETYEAGLVLTGTEVKSLRLGKANLRDGYARVDGREVWLLGVHISPYAQGNRYNHDPLRPRKLLLHKSEIHRLLSRTKERGLTLVPLKLYLKNGMAKVEIGVAKGKKLYDKRETVARRDAEREIEQAFRERQKEQP